MSKYYLTEAYGELYNPRKADETFYENLRFVDYLMQEEIEEVMESLLWEFMDYGNTLDESYGLIENAFSDVILEGVLTEARMSPRQKAERAARVGAERQETLKQVSGQKATQRREARKAAVVGGLKKAKETVGKAATGAGSAAMGALRAGKKAATGAYDRAKGLPGKAMAALKGLARKGAAAAIKSGRSTERAGKEAERTTVTTTSTSGGGRGAAPSTQTTVEKSGGSKRRAVGGLLQKAGKALAGKLKAKPDRMTRGEYEERKAGRAAAASASVGSVAPTTPTPDKSKMKKSSQGIRPYGVGKQETAKGTPYSELSKKKATQLGSQQKVAQLRRKAGSPEERVPSGTTGGRGEKKERGGSVYGEKTFTTSSGRQVTRNVRIREDYDYELLAQYILEDFINEGYADTYEDALEILENLSEQSIVELTEMYLEG
jgi:hypothetical protein